MKRNITDKIAKLDPKKDYEEISFLLQAYEFPWDYERALEFALFRTLRGFRDFASACEDRRVSNTSTQAL